MKLSIELPDGITDATIAVYDYRSTQCEELPDGLFVPDLNSPPSEERTEIFTAADGSEETVTHFVQKSSTSRCGMEIRVWSLPHSCFLVAIGRGLADDPQSAADAAAADVANSFAEFLKREETDQLVS